MLAANLIFACGTFSLKLIPADMFDIMIIRFSIQSIVFGSYAVFYKHYNVFDTNGQPIACALNILTSSGTNLSYLAAFYFLPLSDLNTIKYTYIVWAAILSVIFLNERFKCVNSISLFFTIAGLILATKPHFFIQTLSHIFDQSSVVISNLTTSTSTTTIATTAATSPYYYLGIALAFVASLTKAIQMIARKQLIRTKQPYSVMNFQFTATAFFVVLAYSIIRRFWQPGPYPWKWMGTAGVIIGCSQLLSNTFLAKALKRENVQLLSILDSLDIVYAVILQYIFFRQKKSWIFCIGALLIVTSAIILSVDSHLTNKRERQRKTINDKNHENDNTNV
jgi:drug/metabolite transporter (DMT)-like permease